MDERDVAGFDVQDELELTIIWPPEMALAERTSLRTIVAALGSVTEAWFLDAGADLPKVVFEILTAFETPRGGVGRYERLGDGRCHITLALGGTTLRDADGAIITTAHEFGHLIVDTVRDWPAAATVEEVVADSVVDEYLAERMGWALIDAVAVPMRTAVMHRLRALRIAGVELRIESHRAADTDEALRDVLYHMAYARGARDAGASSVEPPARSDILEPVERALLGLREGLPAPVDFETLRSASAAPMRAVVAEMWSTNRPWTGRGCERTRPR